MSIMRISSGLILAAAVAVLSQPNTLTDAEKAQGWVSLFDGKSLNGWHTKNETVTNSSWILNDSAIHRGPNSGGNIYSPVTAESFEFSVDWKLKDENGNSGVWMRMMESLTEANRSGPEIQVCGKLNADYTRDKRTVGACYMMYHPNPGPDAWVKPAGQWNTFRVIMDGKHVEHWANGVKVVEYEIGSADWISRQNQAEDRIKNPRYGEVHYGSIVLTDHTTLVWYRNLKMRPLAGTTLKSAFPGWVVPVSINGANASAPARDRSLHIGEVVSGPEGFAGEVLSLDGKRLRLSGNVSNRLARGAYLLLPGKDGGAK
jgi:hypothetical protein